MPLTAGSRLGAYEIRSRLGVGGMGEVYQAQDTRLGRLVALKVLRTDLSANDDRKKRFEREARAVSSLNHPHICALYDIGCEDGVDFLVLEHLEGETLVDRLQRGPVPLDEALRLGIEICGALDSAHRRGVVHRDLKPNNIMLTKFGAKLLDFGLASLKAPRSAETPAAQSAPTETVEPRLTAEATVIGTVPYMSPEQLEGKDADVRGDVFALGVVLYEMITRRRPFDGDTSTALMASILKSEPPPPSSIRPDVPRSLDHVVERCLAKNPEDRWQSAHDVAVELEWIRKSMAHDVTSRSASRPARRRWLAWTVAVAAGFTGLALGLLASHSERAPSPREPIRFSIHPPAGATSGDPYWSHPAVSPDGRSVAFRAAAEGTSALWVRRLDAFSSERLSGTDGALAPFWSPDSRFIGFFSQFKLKTIAASGGVVRTICDVAGPAATGSWSHDGTIVFTVAEAPGHDGLYQVSANGGEPDRLRLEDEQSHREITFAFFPQFLPDSRQFLFLHVDSANGPVHYLASLDEPLARPILQDATWLYSQVEYCAPGTLLGAKENTLVAHGFDAKSGRLEGKPVPVADDVKQAWCVASFSVSRNGVIVYVPLTGAGSRLGWFDRSGRPLGQVGEPAEYTSLHLSPDDQRLAVSIEAPRTGTEDIWIFRIPEGTPTRLTSESQNHIYPIWSPDGRQIVFSTEPDGTPHLFHMVLDGSKARVLVPMNGHVQRAEDWSSDGRTVVYTDRDPTTGLDLWTVSLEGDGQLVPLVRTRFNETEARFSPNGRWMAYTSDETGRDEIYVQPYPGPGEKRRVSTSGGWGPRWGQDGREIFYVEPAAEPLLLSVPLDPMTANLLETPRQLFRMSVGVRDYDVTRDGQRFLVNYDAEAGTKVVAHVVIDWTAQVPK